MIESIDRSCFCPPGGGVGDAQNLRTHMAEPPALPAASPRRSTPGRSGTPPRSTERVTSLRQGYGDAEAPQGKPTAQRALISHLVSRPSPAAAPPARWLRPSRPPSQHPRLAPITSRWLPGSWTNAAFPFGALAVAAPLPKNAGARNAAAMLAGEDDADGYGDYVEETQPAIPAAKADADGGKEPVPPMVVRLNVFISLSCIIGLSIYLSQVSTTSNGVPHDERAEHAWIAEIEASNPKHIACNNSYAKFVRICEPSLLAQAGVGCMAPVVRDFPLFSLHPYSIFLCFPPLLLISLRLSGDLLRAGMQSGHPCCCHRLRLCHRLGRWFVCSRGGGHGRQV